MRHPNAAVPPAAPSDLSLYTYPAPTSIEVSWTSNSTNENSFSVERKVEGQPDTAFTPVGSADPVDSVGARVYFTDPTGLDFDTIYDYRVRAIAADGTPSDYSNTTTGTTAPANPISVSIAAVAGTDNKLALSWVDNANHTYYFRIWRKAPGETTFTLYGYWGGPEGGGATGKGVAFTYTDTGLTVSSAYAYYITPTTPPGKATRQTP